MRQQHGVRIALETQGRQVLESRLAATRFEIPGSLEAPEDVRDLDVDQDRFRG